ncbi:uncharacterized protein ACN427_001667 isoform 1-T1 [Glossina fuscipes fuscipes]
MDSPVKNTEGTKRKQLEDEEEVTKRVKEELPSTSSPIKDNKVEGEGIENESLTTPKKVCEQAQSSIPISKFVNRFVWRHWWESTLFECQRVHDSWDYHDIVKNNSTYLPHSIFLNYFVVKVLAFNHGKECIDYRAAAIEECPQIFGEVGADIASHYEIYKRKSSHPMANLDAVKIVSLAHFLYYKQAIPDPNTFHISKSILLTIMNYLNQLLYDNMETYVRVEFGGLIGNVNIIFHDEKDNVRNLYQIKVARTDNFYSTLLQAQICAYCYSKERDTMINKITIYRPLSGIEEIMDVDFKKIEELVYQKN